MQELGESGHLAVALEARQRLNELLWEFGGTTACVERPTNAPAKAGRVTVYADTEDPGLTTAPVRLYVGREGSHYFAQIWDETSAGLGVPIFEETEELPDRREFSALQVSMVGIARVGLYGRGRRGWGEIELGTVWEHVGLLTACRIAAKQPHPQRVACPIPADLCRAGLVAR
jgi:hypothetical protein